jgi:hypothetical protein
MIRRLTGSDQLTLTLRLRRAVSLPIGELVAPDGTETEFEGWLQLLSAITEALEGAPPSGAPSSPPSQRGQRERPRSRAAR